MNKPIIYHIPVCPFSQRVEILLQLKGLRDAVEFRVIDVTVPRPDWLLEKTGGTTVLPVLEDEQGRILKESLVILRYFEERFAQPLIARKDPYERGVERLMIAHAERFTDTGYTMVLNTDPARTPEFREKMLDHYRWLGVFLDRHNPGGLFLFDDFGLAEVVYTPLFMRFWFLDYYEGFDIPDTAEFARVRAWKAACEAHPAAQQVTFEQIVTLYYDYAIGAGNGALPEGRKLSSFVFEPDWRDRPLPPKDKYARIATDAELGLA
ncbi:glutathione S-transferase family protein [Oceanibium sediminis]|uniref:glutathione S-transferase family protein n=1 Tax=Oceanibium sediminis TaxID=2026339 RepID=UPI000DD479C6|nr:glutathione S-transferase family protein [Oceanibium sediminis]